MGRTELSPAAKRRALHVRLRRIRQKISRLEAELAETEGEPAPQSPLFLRGHPGLRALRERVAQLKELAAKTEAELRRKR